MPNQPTGKQRKLNIPMNDNIMYHMKIRAAIERLTMPEMWEKSAKIYLKSVDVDISAPVDNQQVTDSEQAINQ